MGYRGGRRSVSPVFNNATMTTFKKLHSQYKTELSYDSEIFPSSVVGGAVLIGQGGMNHRWIQNACRVKFSVMKYGDDGGPCVIGIKYDYHSTLREVDTLILRIALHIRRTHSTQIDLQTTGNHLPILPPGLLDKINARHGPLIDSERQNPGRVSPPSLMEWTRAEVAPYLDLSPRADASALNLTSSNEPLSPQKERRLWVDHFYNNLVYSAILKDEAEMVEKRFHVANMIASQRKEQPRNHADFLFNVHLLGVVAYGFLTLKNFHATYHQVFNYNVTNNVTVDKLLARYPLLIEFVPIDEPNNKGIHAHRGYQLSKHEVFQVVAEQDWCDSNCPQHMRRHWLRRDCLRYLPGVLTEAPEHWGPQETPKPQLIATKVSSLAPTIQSDTSEPTPPTPIVPSHVLAPPSVRPHSLASSVEPTPPWKMSGPGTPPPATALSGGPPASRVPRCEDPIFEHPISLLIQAIHLILSSASPAHDPPSESVAIASTTDSTPFAQDNPDGGWYPALVCHPTEDGWFSVVEASTLINDYVHPGGIGGILTLMESFVSDAGQNGRVGEGDVTRLLGYVGPYDDGGTYRPIGHVDLSNFFRRLPELFEIKEQGASEKNLDVVEVGNIEDSAVSERDTTVTSKPILAVKSREEALTGEFNGSPHWLAHTLCRILRRYGFTSPASNPPVGSPAGTGRRGKGFRGKEPSR